MQLVLDVGNVTTVAQGDVTSITSLRGMLSFRARVGRTGTMMLSMGESSSPGQVRFGTGMIPLIRKLWAQPMGVSLAINDRRVVPLIQGEKHAADWLRPYQQEALRACLAEPRGIISHPTGTGKGELVVALVGVRPVPTLIIVPNQPLLSQIAERFVSRLNVRPSIFGGGFHDIGHLTVSTYQAINAAKRFPWGKFQQVIFDEVHGAASPTCLHQMNQLTNAYYRYGFSATALLRADQKHYYVIAAFGDVIHKMTFREAVHEHEAIAAPTFVYIPYTHVPTGCPSKDWHVAYRGAIVDNRTRNAAAMQALRSAPKPCMVFTQSVDHAHEIHRLTSLWSTKTALAHGENSKEHPGILEATRTGGIEVLTTTAVMTQGVDIPMVASMMNLAGGKAPIPVIQKVGRAARRFTGGAVAKTEFSVYDMADVGCGCRGVAHADCELLLRHFLDRQSHYGKLR